MKNKGVYHICLPHSDVLGGKKGLDFKMKKYNCVNCKQVIVFESNGKFQEYESHFETGFKYCWNCAIKECKIDIEWAKHLGLDLNEN